MNVLFIFLLIIFLHIIADFNLQGILSSLKQKRFWIRKNIEKECFEICSAKTFALEHKYRFDYWVALFIHSFMWIFIVMLPVAFKMNFNINFAFILLFILNLIIHVVVDDLKANKLKISLLEDQGFHLLQLLSIFTFYISV